MQIHRGSAASPAAALSRAPQWVIYASFDAAGAASPHAVAQLRGYRELGFETIVVDTSAQLSPERERDWDAWSTLWFRRANDGYDFGSYKHAAALLVETLAGGTEALSLLLTNDSCFGPYIPFADVFERVASLGVAGNRVFGMTDNDQFQHHLQSYWLYFPADVSGLALAFLREMPYVKDRDEAIQRGELSFSSYLSEHGVQLTALCPSEAVVAHFARFRSPLLSAIELGIRRLLKRPRYTRRGDAACLKHWLGRPYAVNVTMDFGTHMHFQRLTPFVKRQLIRDNPSDDPLVPPCAEFSTLDNAGVARVLRGTSGYRRRYGLNYQGIASWLSSKS